MQIREDDYITACVKDDILVIRQCIKAKIPMPHDTIDEKNSGFAVACMYGNLDTVKLFLEEMVYDNSEDICYGLMRAIMSSKAEVVNYLLANYKEKHELLKDHSTLFSLSFGREKMFYILVEHDISFSTEDNQPTIIRESFFHREDIFKTTIENSNSNQLCYFFEDLIIRGDKKYTQGDDKNIYIADNKNYSVLFNHLKNLDENILNDLKTSCDKYIILDQENAKVLKSNAQILVEKVDSVLLFYKLNNKIENKVDKVKKSKI